MKMLILALVALPAFAQQDNSNHNNLTFQIGAPSSTQIVDRAGAVVKITVVPSPSFFAMEEAVANCQQAVEQALPALQYYLNRFPAATANQEWRPGIQSAAERLEELKVMLTPAQTQP